MLRKITVAFGLAVALLCTFTSPVSADDTTIFLDRVLVPPGTSDRPAIGFLGNPTLGWYRDTTTGWRLAGTLRVNSDFTVDGSTTMGALAPTSITTGAGVFTSVTDSGLTATRVPFASTGGLLADDGDMTFATDTLSITKVISSSLTASQLVVTNGSKQLASNGAITTNNIPRSASSGATLVDSAVSDDGTTVITNRQAAFNFKVTTAAVYAVTPTDQTVADSGGVGAAAANVAATVGKVYVTCSDADGCDLTLLETDAVNGSELAIVNVSANACNLADTSGVSETTGAIALGQWDSAHYAYVTDRWVLLGSSNN